MKLSRWLFLFTLLTGLNSCMWGVKNNQPTGAITKDTLVYTYQTIHERAADCGNKPDSGCTAVNIKYPVFKDQKELTDTITHKLLNLFVLNKQKDTSLNQLAKNFIKSYEENKKQDKRELFYTLDSYCNIIRQDSSIITLEFGGYAFEGGAHGGHQTIFIDWNAKTNKKLTLSDIFIDGYQGKLNAIAEHIFRKDEKLSDTATLANDYFFDNNKFALNNNFLITPLGIKFLYNEYEIKPYVAGQTEIFIPYSQIRSLLKPNTVVSQYHK